MHRGFRQAVRFWVVGGGNKGQPDVRRDKEMRHHGATTRHAGDPLQDRRPAAKLLQSLGHRTLSMYTGGIE